MIGVSFSEGVANGFIIEVIAGVDRCEQFQTREIPQTNQSIQIAAGFESTALSVVDFGEQSHSGNGCWVLFDELEQLGFGLRQLT